MRVQKTGQKPTNRNWGKPMPSSNGDNCAFDKIVAKLKLSPEQYTQSEALRAWVKRYHRSRYVPEDLLLSFNVTVQFED